MARNAICMRCGSFKSAFVARCGSCGFEPKSDIDIAKSRILGPVYSFTIDNDGIVVETGRSKSELLAISDQIRSGKPYEFSDEEVKGVLAAYRAVKSMTPGQALRMMLPLYIGTTFAVVGFVYVIWMLFRIHA